MKMRVPLLAMFGVLALGVFVAVGIPAVLSGSRKIPHDMQ